MRAIDANLANCVERTHTTLPWFLPFSPYGQSYLVLQQVPVAPALSERVFGFPVRPRSKAAIPALADDVDGGPVPPYGSTQTLQ